MSDNARSSWNIHPLLVLTFGTVCLSFAAVFVKMLGMEIMGPTAIGFWRALLGAAILFGWSASAGKSLRMPRKVIGLSLLAGFIFFLDLFFWHRSIIFSGVGMATILANTQVFVVALLGVVFFRERLSPKFLVSAVSAIVGITLLIGVGSTVEFGGRYVAGVGYGLLTGVVYGSYIVVMKIIGHRDDRPDFRVIMAWTSLFTALFLGLAATAERTSIMPPDLYSWSVLSALALVVQVLGWWAIANSLPRLVVSRSSLSLLLQPLLATVWGVLFFGEYLTVIQIAGGVVTLGAIYVGSVRWLR
ncbi:MAG: DMT family transporter [candidate division Zixibacteria bacterium]|nr:DMT family transporter [candidate division Zixibacteria bacterium]